ncbi:hypothetical protein SAMN05421553_4780 [Pseudomonas anguilliseptica]|uniref:Uncharacterized protein n=1 Tax=Pseudomonas anguilliseptica TaxID=53406 RepID=A0A1H5ISJ0_PSEAG|nr:hypothetical protein SAMN05421553_4780 [Pseudomonas anguilliseptica]
MERLQFMTIERAVYWLGIGLTNFTDSSLGLGLNPPQSKQVRYPASYWCCSIGSYGFLTLQLMTGLAFTVPFSRES